MIPAHGKHDAGSASSLVGLWDFVDRIHEGEWIVTFVEISPYADCFGEKRLGYRERRANDNAVGQHSVAGSRSLEGSSCRQKGSTEQKLLVLFTIELDGVKHTCHHVARRFTTI